MTSDSSLPAETTSLCPDCLEPVPGRYEAGVTAIYLRFDGLRADTYEASREVGTAGADDQETADDRVGDELPGDDD